MAQAIVGFPDAAQHILTTDLSGVMYQVRMTWSERLDAWYVDLLTRTGDPLILGRRMSAGWTPWQGVVLEGLPSGVVLIRGQDNYARDDLGDSVRLVSYDESTLDATTYPDLGIS